MSKQKPEPVAQPAPLAAEARNELQRGWRIFKAFEHADKALAVLENLEQLTSERQKAADAAFAAAQKADDEAGKAIQALAAVKTEAQEVRAKAKSEAGAMLEKAAFEAHAITSDARATLADLEARAAEQTAALKAHKTALADISAELGQARETILKAAKLREAMAGV